MWTWIVEIAYRKGRRSSIKCQNLPHRSNALRSKTVKSSHNFCGIWSFFLIKSFLFQIRCSILGFLSNDCDWLFHMEHNKHFVCTFGSWYCELNFEEKKEFLLNFKNFNGLFQMINIITFNEVVILIWHVLLVYGQILVICIFGQYQLDCFEGLNESIFMSEWYRFPVKSRRLLNAMLVAAQQPVYIRGFGSGACTRESFKEVFE